MRVRKMNLGGIKSKDESGRTIEGIANEEICSKCGGKCCKRIGCAYYPEDLEDLRFEGLKKEIAKGFISIDIDAEETMNFYLRARNKYASIYDLNASGVCKALEETGCKYTFEERPTQGRLLIPLESTECKSSVTSVDLGKAWEPYQEILKQLSEYYLGLLGNRDLRLRNGELLTKYLDNNMTLDSNEEHALRRYKMSEPSCFSLNFNFLGTLDWLYEYKDFNILYDEVWHGCKDDIYKVMKDLEKANLLTEDIYIRDIIAWIIYSV